ncbi:allatostatin-A receptor-like [Ptychodera flava]|uniref:allatostatin-A receptor-like n=1 Tax=Ptychodera flava TaxID=63121 RepID=UPI003969C7C1
MANLTNEVEDGTYIPLSLVEKTLKMSWGVIGVVGMMANAFVIFIFLRVPSLRSITNMFLINQSLLDFASSAILVAVKFTPVKWPLRLGAFNDFVCKVWVSEYLNMGVVVASTLNLICVSFERYFAIVHPLLHRDWLTETKAKVVMALVWVLGYISELVWMVINRAKDGFCTMVWPSATYQNFFGFYFIVLVFIMPVSLMTYAYLRILVSLRQTNPALDNATSASGPDGVGGRAAAMSKASRNVLKTLVTVFLAYVCCWLPQQCMFFMYTIGLPVDLTSNGFNVAMVLVNCNMLVNPFIYVFQYRQFIRGVRETFRRRKATVAPKSTTPATDRRRVPANGTSTKQSTSTKVTTSTSNT